MYACPNCAAALRFSIRSQDLFCDHCDAHFNPYDIEKDQDAEFTESGMYETGIFTCPECGGELYSTDSQAAGFCSYCGSPTILTYRMEQKIAPASIIPFTVTKEESIKRYKAALRYGLFAPGKMLSKGHIEKFRAIYMPYWRFTVSQNNVLHLETHHIKEVGEYLRHRIYRIDARILAEYGGITYDGSSLFLDSISKEIAPYDLHQVKKFTPSYLLGFYADLPDVPADYYMEQAEAEAKQDLYDYVACSDRFDDVPGVLDREGIKDEVSPSVSKVDMVLFPVWFVSYRYKDRISYAIVNGQTGKISADLPISVPKYLLLSLGIAGVIFLFLLLFSSFRPIFLLYTMVLCSAVTMFVYHLDLREIYTELLFRDDVGFTYRTNQQKGVDTDPEVENAVNLQKQKYARRRLRHVIADKKEELKDRIQDRKKETSTPLSFLWFLFRFGNYLSNESWLGIAFGILACCTSTLPLIFILCLSDKFFASLEPLKNMPADILSAFEYLFFHIIPGLDYRIVGIVLGLITIVLMVIMSIREKEMQKGINEKIPHIPGVIYSGSALLIALITMAINPANPLWFYLATSLCLLAEILAMVQLVRFYNYLATRELPQHHLYEREE